MISLFLLLLLLVDSRRHVMAVATNSTDRPTIRPLVNGATPRLQPPLHEQIHLALAETLDTMRVQWITMEPAGDVFVDFDTRSHEPRHRVAARTKLFDSDGIVRHVHTAEMRPLSPNTLYCAFGGREVASCDSL